MLLRAQVFLSAALLSMLLSCADQRVPADTPILLFTGPGTSRGDISAMRDLLNKGRFSWVSVTSADLNAMDAAQFKKHRLLIVPGGNFIDMSKSLTPEATANIHQAVEGGLNYLGLCAGAFVAGDSSHYNSFKLASGVQFGFYAVESQGIRKAAVPIALSNGPTLEQYWEDGPQLAGWGSVVGRYPDGTPAIVEGAVGRGWVILSGVHPEAQESWRDGIAFRTSVHDDNAYALTLIRAALSGTELPHY